MTIHPLAFNLVDNAKNVAVIGEIPSSAMPQPCQDVISFWQEEFKSKRFFYG